MFPVFPVALVFVPLLLGLFWSLCLVDKGPRIPLSEDECERERESQNVCFVVSKRN